MGKQVAQGTRLESRIRTDATQLGRKARRTAKRGQANEADVVIEGADIRPAVVWQHMRRPEGRQRRVSSTMVVIDYATFLDVVESTEYGWAIQAKCSQRLAVSTIFRGLVSWMREHGV